MVKLFSPPEEGDKSSGLFQTELQKGEVGAPERFLLHCWSGHGGPSRWSRSSASLVFSPLLWSLQTKKGSRQEDVTDDRGRVPASIPPSVCAAASLLPSPETF